MHKILKSSLLTAAMLVSIHPAQAATIVGLTTANQLVRFNSATPSITSAPLAVTGILSGQTLTGIDFRPVDGALVGVSLSNSGTAQAYTINQTTGVATTIGNSFSVLPQTVTLGIDFNPVPNALRIVTDAEQNLRITIGGTGVFNTDTALSRTGSADPTLRVVSAAYTNNNPGGFNGATSLYVINAADGSLYLQGIANFTGSPAAQGPNGGLLTLVGSLGLGTNLTNNIGFDINNLGEAFVSIGANTLYTINVANGATTSLGAIGANFTIRDIAAEPVPEPATILISAMGLLTVGLLRRKR